MKSCDKLVDAGRRHFLSSAGAMTAAAAAVSVLSTEAKADQAPSTLIRYPKNRLGNVADLKVNEPLAVNYPDDDAPGVLIKLGQRVGGGVGADALRVRCADSGHDRW